MFKSFSSTVLHSFSGACGPIALLAFYLVFQTEAAPHNGLEIYYASLTPVVGALYWAMAGCLGLRVVDLFNNRKEGEGWRAFSMMNGLIMLLAALMGYLAFFQNPSISVASHLEIVCFMLMICSMAAMSSDGLRRHVLQVIAA
jgi:hypothetical protein